jgi:hypothetical protein
VVTVLFSHFPLWSTSQKISYVPFSRNGKRSSSLFFLKCSILKKYFLPSLPLLLVVQDTNNCPRRWFLGKGISFWACRRQNNFFFTYFVPCAVEESLNFHQIFDLWSPTLSFNFSTAELYLSFITFQRFSACDSANFFSGQPRIKKEQCCARARVRMLWFCVFRKTFRFHFSMKHEQNY